MMVDNSLTLSTDNIKSKIYTIRNKQVMLDSDIAELYDVDTRVVNQAVKRNLERFPENFMFQLTELEFKILRSQFATSNLLHLKSQFVTSSWGGKRKLPYAFTEQGVAMLSGVLKSETAIRISIQIMNAFVAMRKFISSNAQIFQRLDVVETKQIEHDKKFNEIFDAIQSKDHKHECHHTLKGVVCSALVFGMPKNNCCTLKGAVIL